MPQLDINTFLPQITWLAIIYTSFYLLLTKYTLPTITKILYTRQYKALQAHHHTTTDAHTTQNTPDPVLNACAHATHALVQSNAHTIQWTQSQQKHIHTSQLTSLQHTFTTHQQHALTSLARTIQALKYTMTPSAQHACHMNKPLNIRKTHVFQKTLLHTLFMQHNKTTITTKDSGNKKNTVANNTNSSKSNSGKTNSAKSNSGKTQSGKSNSKTNTPKA